MAVKRPEQKTKKKYLIEQLRETHNDMDCAREMDSWTAVATLRRQALALRAELDALALTEEEDRNAAGRATDDQILGEIVAAVGVMPVSVIEEIMEACEDRVGAPRLRVVK
tara:strand:- start:332 stop:664 length:333 start_codon:yes stop_codon:yes gene_type:complete